MGELGEDGERGGVERRARTASVAAHTWSPQIASMAALGASRLRLVSHAVIASRGTTGITAAIHRPARIPRPAQKATSV